MVKAEKDTECSWAACLTFTSTRRAVRRWFGFLEDKPAPKCSPGVRAEKAVRECKSMGQKHGTKAGTGGVMPFAPLLLNPELERLLQTRSLLTSSYVAEPGQRAEGVWFGMTWLYHQIYPKLDLSLIWSTIYRLGVHPRWCCEHSPRTQQGHKVPSEWCCGVSLQE